MTDWRKLLVDEQLWDYRCKAVPVPLVREIVEEVETLRQDLAAARADFITAAGACDIHEADADQLRSELAAARAESDLAHWLLRNARKYMNPMHEALCAAIDNALQKKQAALAGQRREGE